MKLFVFLFISSLSIQTAFAYSIKFNGISSKDISKATKNSKIDLTKASMGDVDSVIRRLYKLNKFDSVYAVKSNKNLVTIQAESIKYIDDIAFSGNDELSSSALLTASGLREGQKYDRQELESAKKGIISFYKKNGFLSAELFFKVTYLDSTKATISFTITEGKRSTVSSILITTKNDRLKEDLKLKTKLFIGKPLTENVQEDIRNAIISFLSENRFLTASISDSKIVIAGNKENAIVEFNVTTSYKYEVILHGNKSFDDVTLYKALNLSNFEKGKNPRSYVLNTIKDFYLKQGYEGITLKLHERISKKTNTLWLNLKIKEGPKVRISNFEIRGRISKPQKYYINFIKDNSSTLISKMIFNQADFDLGVQNLVTHLKNKGYLQAKIASIRTERNKTGSEVALIIYLNEGPLTLINRISFSGNKNIPQNELIKQLGLKSRAPLDSDILEVGLRNIKTFYDGRGYIEAEITNEGRDIINYTAEGTVASIHIKLKEGPKVTVRSILIEGNTYTHDDVILTEIPFRVGDTVTSELIEDAQNRLNNLGIFNLVQISTLEKKSNLKERTLVISVIERDPGILRFGIGATDENDLTFRGYLGVSYNNLAGKARSASIRADLLQPININETNYKVALGYLEPFMFSSRTRGSINLKSYQLLDNIDADPINIEVSSSVAFGLDREVGKYTTLSLFYKFERSQTFTSQDKLNKDTTDVATVGPIISYDNRDNPFLPTKGNYARLLMEYSSPEIGSSRYEGLLPYDGTTPTVEFYKVDTGISHYFRVDNSSNVILAVNLRGGYLENLGGPDSAAVPKNYSFALGGRSTIRGFDASSENDKLLPEVELPTIDSSVSPAVSIANRYILYSQSYQLLKLELRFPFYEDFGGVFFYDAGALYAKNVFQEKPFRQTAGFGLRYNTPFGPVNFEFGFKLDRIPEYNEDPFKFHFSIGTF